jgi:hypothetical protein
MVTHQHWRQHRQPVMTRTVSTPTLSPCCCSDPSKWLHASLKVIHKALKQAKVFEVRKITRRLQQARAAADASSDGTTLAAKLEQQLCAAKAADLEQLARQAAAKARLVAADAGNDSSAAAANGTAPAGQGAGVASAVHQRLLAAACVQKQVAQQVAEFNRKFGPPAAAAGKQLQVAAAAAATAAAGGGAGSAAGGAAASSGTSSGTGSGSDGHISHDCGGSSDADGGADASAGADDGGTATSSV